MSWRAHGMRTWILQRLTAVYMLLYLILFGLDMLKLPAVDFASWQGLFKTPTDNIATVLFFYAVLFHAWIGVRDILIDYVPLASLRLILWILMSLGLLAMGIWISMVMYAVVSL